MKPFKMIVRLLITLLCLLSPVVNAQTEFSLKELLENAEKHSPVLKLAASDIDSADGLFQQSRSPFSPSLILTTGYKHWDQDRSGNMGARPGATQFYSNQLTNTTLQARQLLLESGKFKNRYKSAAEKKESFELSYARIRQELFFEVLGLGITSINQTAKIEAYEKNLSDIDEALKNIRTMKEVGKVAHVAVLRMEFRRQEALAILDEASHQQNLLLTKIARVVGLEDVPDKINNQDLEITNKSVEENLQSHLIETALGKRPDYLAEEKRLKAAGYDLSAVKKELRPELNFIASFNRYGNRTGWGVNNGFAGVEIAWPLADGGANRGKIKTVNAQKDKAYQHLEQLRLKISEEIRSAISSVRTSRSKIDRSEKGLALAEETYRIEKLTYENGKNTINDLLDAQSEVFSARARLIQDQNDLVVANLALSLALGEVDSFSQSSILPETEEVTCQ